VIAEHRKVIEALAARNPEQARKAMHSHLSRAHGRWARRLESSKKSKLNNRH
jgi:DNA-binding FadR family transcriptional regulator